MFIMRGKVGNILGIQKIQKIQGRHRVVIVKLLWHLVELVTGCYFKSKQNNNVNRDQLHL